MSREDQKFKASVLTIQGRVVTGVGEGKLFLCEPHYCSQIEKLFGFRPFPGTLNLRLSPEDHGRVLEFTRPGLKVLLGRDLSSEDKKLFSVGAHPCEFLGVEAVLLFPEKTRHRDVVELAAPVSFRETKDVKDGDFLEVVIGF
jgi:riboflavin kinase, archaea type